MSAARMIEARRSILREQQTNRGAADICAAKSDPHPNPPPSLGEGIKRNWQEAAYLQTRANQTEVTLH
jgi:hypothetical protein